MSGNRSVDEVGRRRSDRILASVRIRVAGNDASGVAFSEDTVTINFNQQGARISLVHSLLPYDIVLIRNMENGIEEEFRVVGGFQQVIGDRREWGVEATSPMSKIWGIEFVPHGEDVQPKVLIECVACEKAALSTVSSIEYDILLATGLISRHCTKCGETTRWRPSEQTLTSTTLTSVRKQVIPERARTARRLKMAMKLRVRNQRGTADTVQTRDVSKSGLCFVSSKRFKVGEEVFVTQSFADKRDPVETKGRVVWSAEGSVGQLYGVMFTH